MFLICQVLHMYLIYNIQIESYSSKNLIYLYYKVDNNSKLYNKNKIFKLIKQKHILMNLYINALELEKQYKYKINSSTYQIAINHYNKALKKNKNQIENIKNQLHRIEYHENLLLNIYKK